MSSARKRGAIKKANTRVEYLEQKLMLTEHHLSMIKTIAEIAAMKYDERTLEFLELKMKHCPDELTEDEKKLYETLKKRVEESKLKPQGVTNETTTASSNITL